MIHHSYITRKLAFNEGGQLIWRLNPNKGRLAAHDRGKGPVVKMAGHDYPADDVVNALLKGTGLEAPTKAPRKPRGERVEKPPRQSGPHPGVIALNGRYRATVNFLKRQKHVGLFDTVEEAQAAQQEFVSKCPAASMPK